MAMNFLISKSTERRGSLAVEAAIFLPIFILGMLTLGYLIKLTGIEENVFHILSDETHKLAAESSVLPIPTIYESDLRTRLTEENRGEISDIDVSPLLYRVPSISAKGRVYTDLIGVSVSYKVPLKIAPIFRSEILAEETVLCRAFVGANNDGTVKSFEEMEQADDSVKVWVFPRAGERYHGENCTYINNEPRELLLDKSVRSKYTPCSLCKAGSAANGSLVYCFPTSGQVYHIGSCYIVERYVISMSEEDAQSQGYTACSKCGGR
jgi:hypothetical protein